MDGRDRRRLEWMRDFEERNEWPASAKDLAAHEGWTLGGALNCIRRFQREGWIDSGRWVVDAVVFPKGPFYMCPKHGPQKFKTCDVCAAQCDDWNREAA